MLPDANYLSSRCQSQSPRAQNRGFCALFAFGIPIFGTFEHKIGIFVRFCGLEPPFSGISSTKSRFLCAFCPRDPRFRAFRVQNRHFCALWWGHGSRHGWGDGWEQWEQREQREQQELREQRQQQGQQERRPGEFGLLTFCHKGALFELWHSI